MSDRFLNVVYENCPARIDTKSLVDISQVQMKIEQWYCKDFPEVTALRVTLWTDTLVDDWKELKKLAQYFKPPKEGGLFLTIQLDTLERQSGETGTYSLTIAGIKRHLSEESLVVKKPRPWWDYLSSWVPSIIVKRPSSTIVGTGAISAGIFIPCQTHFYNDIYHAVELDGFLLFREPVPSSTVNRLYIRESYQTIASSIRPGFSKAIITGTPGIGKSLFMMYLLWKLVKAGRRVLIIYHPETIYYDGHGGVFFCPTLPNCNELSFWNADLWCLFDAKGKTEAHVGALPYNKCTFVLSTSPRREMVNDFQKPPVPQKFYMPLWKETELEAIAPCFSDVADWPERFRILGGIPRYVLEITGDNPTKLLEAACNQCDLRDCVTLIGLNSTITEKTKVVHALVHMNSKTPFTEISVSYASKTALDIIFRNKNGEAKRKMQDLLGSCGGNPLTASLCGYIFERFAFELLEKGGDFICRELVHSNTKKLPEEKTLTIPSSTKIIAEKVALDQQKDQLYIPSTANYPGIDAWMHGIGAFQMTVGKSHDIKVLAKDDLALLDNKLYFLLLPLYYESFTKKTPNGIDQFAVRIPYPE